MHAVAPPAAEAAIPSRPCDAGEFDLDAAIERIAHWLPSQRPIKDFVHHNTLHAVQHLPFHQGVAVAARVFGAYSYLPLADYQERYRHGKIPSAAIDWALARAEPDLIAREALRKSLFEADHTVHYPPESLASHGLRERWLTHVAVNLNALVQPVLFRVVANFLDQGISRWTIARSDESLWECLWRLVEASFVPLFPFSEPAARSALRQSPECAIHTCLQRIVGAEELYEQYLLEMLLTHPGWSGMVRCIEEHPESLLARRRITLQQFIAFELALELAFLHRKRGPEFLPVVRIPRLHQTARLASVTARAVVPQRLKVWHEAMEYSLHGDLIQALGTAAQSGRAAPRVPTAQALFCIDDRECSLRRHLETADPGIDTYGAAGFFGIDFLFQGIDDAYAVAQCPVVVTPRHLVVESAATGRRPAADRNAARTDLAQFHFQPNSLLRGWFLTQTLGLGYAARLAFDVFRPGSKRLRIRGLGEIKAHTTLHLLRETDTPTADGRLLGFSHEEMADRIENQLRTIGLVDGFAPLLVVVAHGSTSVNNPHFAAYDCGACAGKPGAPNARAFAMMANDPTVRELLRARGIAIPATTRCVAALHNTSRDEIVYFDEHLWAEAPPPGLADFQRAMATALRANAHERCRWFELGPGGDDPELALRHVQSRAASIFEPRPELNHSNNLYCVVGRRSLTRSLFLDRRAFLHSYDPDSDPEGLLLNRILAAVIPVCGGINLEYLFSRIDNSVYGAGTKLPHNVIGLLGVANGVDGDLRTGLPSQMIEVHEPARLLIVVDQHRATVETAIDRLGELREWLDNAWVRLACCHPETRACWLRAGDGWEPFALDGIPPTPSGPTAEMIYRGRTDTIPVHLIQRISQ